MGDIVVSSSVCVYVYVCVSVCPTSEFCFRSISRKPLNGLQPYYIHMIPTCPRFDCIIGCHELFTLRTHHSNLMLLLFNFIKHTSCKFTKIYLFPACIVWISKILSGYLPMCWMDLYSLLIPNVVLHLRLVFHFHHFIVISLFLKKQILHNNDWKRE
jgi:hypothetical protein